MRRLLSNCNRCSSGRITNGENASIAIIFQFIRVERLRLKGVCQTKGQAAVAPHGMNRIGLVRVKN